VRVIGRSGNAPIARLGTPALRRGLRWLLLAAGATVLVFATRAYLDPAAIIDLANVQLC
jgi:hypothetical protein